MQCSARLVRAFLRVAAKSPRLRSEVAQLSWLSTADSVELQLVCTEVARLAVASGDDCLGLSAALEMYPGCGGALDYAANSASTILESFRVASRFAWMYCDALEPRLRLKPREACILLDGCPHASRTVIDFMVGTWFRCHLGVHLRDEPSMACRFTYAEPRNLTLHRAVFGNARLVFGASKYGRASARHIAGLMRISRRTLVRRLVEDGTSFRLELEKFRRESALQLVETSSLPYQQISSQLGFSHVQAFSRAFKRWTGRTPAAFRCTSARSDSGAIDHAR